MNTPIVWADTDRNVVLVEGEDAGAFLHSQLAQDIAGLGAGETVHSLLLEPTGHVHSIVRVVRHSDTLYTLDCDAPYGESIITRLRRFVLRSRVTLTLGDWTVRAYRGTDAAAALGSVSGLAQFAWGSRGAVDMIGPAGSQPTVGEETEAGHIEMLRVDACWPRLGVDVLVGDVPATTGLLGVAVSFDKGCYPGQELVERMDSRGADAPVNLRVVKREGVGVGSRVEASPTDSGTVTSVGFSSALVRVGRNSAIGQPLQFSEWLERRVRAIDVGRLRAQGEKPPA